MWLRLSWQVLFLGLFFLAAALVAAFFFAGAFLPLPVLAAFSAIKATAISMVTSAGASVPLGKCRVDLAKLDMYATIASVHHMLTAPPSLGVLAQFLDQRLWPPPARPPPLRCKFFGKLFNGAVHANGEHFLNFFDVGVERAVFDERPIAANAGLDSSPRLRGVGLLRAAGSSRHQGFFQIHIGGWCPALGQAGAGRLLVSLLWLRRAAHRARTGPCADVISAPSSSPKMTVSRGFAVFAM